MCGGITFRKAGRETVCSIGNLMMGRHQGSTTMRLRAGIRRDDIPTLGTRGLLRPADGAVRWRGKLVILVRTGANLPSRTRLSILNMIRRVTCTGRLGIRVQRGELKQILEVGDHRFQKIRMQGGIEKITRAEDKELLWLESSKSCVQLGTESLQLRWTSTKILLLRRLHHFCLDPVKLCTLVWTEDGAILILSSLPTILDQGFLGPWVRMKNKKIMNRLRKRRELDHPPWQSSHYQSLN